MTGLLKADFKRVLKDKLIIVIGIIALVFAISTPLLYVAIFSSTGVEDLPMLSTLISGKAQFFGAFSISNNLGLIAPVLLSIALCKDFSFGTVRNKIIAGKSRSAIFLSLFITCATILTVIILIYAFVTLGISLFFFDYQPTRFTLADFWYFLESLAFEILVLIWVAALISYLCACMKNMGLVIVFYIATSFILVIAGSISQVALPVMKEFGADKISVDIVHFIDRINVGNFTAYIGTGTQYSLEDVLYITIPTIIGILGFIGLGLLRFNKRDLK